MFITNTAAGTPISAEMCNVQYSYQVLTLVSCVHPKLIRQMEHEARGDSAPNMCRRKNKNKKFSFLFLSHRLQLPFHAFNDKVWIDTDLFHIV